jgi:hypothetical protein
VCDEEKLRRCGSSSLAAETASATMLLEEVEGDRLAPSHILREKTWNR